MSRQLEVFQVDAFTRERFAGNPAGVVLGADGLPEALMLAIARELGNADTAFVAAPASPAADLSVRFFTPRTEAGFVGHATLAVHQVLQQLEGARWRRQQGRTAVVEVGPAERGLEIRLQRPPLGRALSDAEVAAVCDALGLARAELDARSAPRIAGSGSTRALVAVKDGATLATLRPDPARLAQLSPAIGAQGFFVFSTAPAVPEADVESRMFCPVLGIAEDPVSGNAHGMLAVHLESLGLLRDGILRGAQGHHLGRPGRVEVRLREADALALRGEAVVVFRTTLEVDVPEAASPP